jgi:hypothetical protein
MNEVLRNATEVLNNKEDKVMENTNTMTLKAGEAYLEARYDARASFYKKAKIIANETTIDLYSYGTKVATYDIISGKCDILGKYSQTTTRHQKEFAKQCEKYSARSIPSIIRDYFEINNKIEFTPGYYEWNLFVNDELIYTVGDFSEYIEDNLTMEDARDLAEGLIDREYFNNKEEIIEKMAETIYNYYG